MRPPGWASAILRRRTPPTGPAMFSRTLAQESAGSAAPIPAARAGLRMIERGEAARVALFQVPAGYKRMGKSWTRAELWGRNAE